MSFEAIISNRCVLKHVCVHQVRQQIPTRTAETNAFCRRKEDGTVLSKDKRIWVRAVLDPCAIAMFADTQQGGIDRSSVSRRSSLRDASTIVVRSSTPVHSDIGSSRQCGHTNKCVRLSMDWRRGGLKALPVLLSAEILLLIGLLALAEERPTPLTLVSLLYLLKLTDALNMFETMPNRLVLQGSSCCTRKVVFLCHSFLANVTAASDRPGQRTCTMTNDCHFQRCLSMDIHSESTGTQTLPVLFREA